MKKVLLAFVILVLLSSCKFPNILKKKESDKSNLGKEYNITVPVTVSKSTKTTLVKYIKTSGTAEALSKTDVISQASGTIDNIYLNDNEFVKENSKIMEIDKSNILVDIKQSKLEYDKAKSEYKAWKNLNNGLSDKQLKLQTGLTQKELQLEKLQIALEKSTITAPFSGIVYDMNLVKGKYVSAGQKLFSIINNDEMIIRVNVLESEINRIKIGSDVIVKFSAITEKLYKGKVISVSPSINQNTHSCEVKINLINDGKIKDGMYAEVKISAEKYPEKILVYKDAILVRDGKKLVFAVENNKAKWQYVKTGVENEYFVEITNGVKENQDIVIKGNFSLSHDAKVKIIKRVEYKKLAEKF